MTDSILLITVDCLRADHVGGYGYARDTTPNIDALIQRGTRFQHAYSNGPGTRFGFKSIHGGTYPLRISGAGLPRHASKTIAEVLREQGYQTGGFSDNPFVSSYFNYNRGFDYFIDYENWIGDSSDMKLKDINRFIRQQVGPTIPKGRIYDILKAGYDSILKYIESTGANANSNDEAVVDQALNWIAEANDSDKPYFAWVHLMDAHHPYGYFPEHRHALNIPTDREHIRMPSVDPGNPPSEILVDAYDTNIRNADAHVGRLLREVEGDPTVVLTADHGEELGLHNRFHKESVYQSMAHIPLVVDAPQFDASESDATVSLIDVPTTIARLADANVPESWDGTDVRDRTNENTVFLGFENSEGISTAVIHCPWKYMCQQDLLTTSPETELLFDFISDPVESQNEIETAEGVYQKLQDKYQNYINEIKGNRLEAERDLWDPSKDLSKTVQESDNDVPSETPEGIDQRLEDLGYK
ncbi:sulfatase [Haloarcula hispanica]|uniref:Sulfatase N-terminal domain-containing protein n=1 Tax=Haloarcula hispanica TaxID=51589 RepID=A0A482TA59_HALHI|nr:sulfatase [Haloarcula hispanica]MCJ0619383.1 sulfatase [Haloarcula hispanica]RYJ09877.1 hypothetical protein ELS20_07575 [Haloarcula hispanica]